MNFSQAEIRAMVFALATLQDNWFEQPHQEMEFSFDDVESALMKVAAYNLDGDTQGATMMRNPSISPPDEPWWDITRPPDKP